MNNHEKLARLNIEINYNEKIGNLLKVGMLKAEKKELLQKDKTLSDDASLEYLKKILGF